MLSKPIPENYLSPVQTSALEESRNHVPQFIFRAFSNESRGMNSAVNIVPDASSYHPTINSISVPIARKMVYEHLIYNYNHPSEFSSWSSSLLFVLVHAVRKAQFLRETNVCICVLDTAKLNAAVAIYPSNALLHIYQFPNENKTRSFFFHHEFLLHRPLRNGADFYRTASLTDLVERGLYQSFIELFSLDRMLLKRVWQLRTCLFKYTSHLTASDICIARQLGELFGADFVLPATLAFLSLRRLPNLEVEIIHDIAKELSDLMMPETYLRNYLGLGGPDVDETGLPEVTQFRCLMQAICDLQCEAD